MLLAKGKKFLQNNSKTKGYIGKYPKDKNKILFLNFKKHNLYNTKKKNPFNESYWRPSFYFIHKSKCSHLISKNRHHIFVNYITLEGQATLPLDELSPKNFKNSCQD